jgi:glucose-1-phosphate thymidylyltransferase
MKSIILAAGFATRLYPLTEDKSKSLLEINGKPIINYIIDKIREVSSEEIIVITNGKFYQDFLNWKEKSNYQNIIILNDGVLNLEKKLGAIGDLLFVINQRGIDEDLFVVSGDNLFQYSLKEPREIFEKEKKDLSIFYDLKDLEEAKRMGVVQVKDNLIIDFQEKPKNPKSTLCSTSTYFFRRETIPLMKRFLEEPGSKDQPGLFLEYLYKRVPVYAYITKEKWIDIGTFESFKKAQTEF